MRVHDQDYQLVLKKGLEANINSTATVNTAIEGEAHYTTDSKVLYIFDGTENIPVGAIQNVSIHAVDYTLTRQDMVVVFTATAIATLPPATGTGQTYRIICRAGTTTITGTGGNTIKGELTQTLSESEDLIISDTAIGIYE